MDYDDLPVEPVLSIDEGCECCYDSIVATGCIVVKCDQDSSSKVRNINPKFFKKG